jgi:hypothetical protein
LKADGEVVEGDEEGVREEEVEEAGGDDDPTFDDVGNHEGLVFLEGFDADKENDEETEANKEADDDGGVPGALDAAVLRGEEVADVSCDDSDLTGKVRLQDVFADGGRCWGVGFGVVKKKKRINAGCLQGED